MQSVYREIIREVAQALCEKIPDRTTAEKLAEDVWKAAVAGGEVEETDPRRWLEERFRPQLVWLDQNDYARALVRALWLAPRFVTIDFGVRRRDFAQLWTDTARGFLGEIAFKKFIEKFGVAVKLETRRGRLEEFLPSDVLVVDAMTGEPRSTRARVSIKTTKFEGRWLDVPGAQFDRSDVFVLVKLGISRLHFLAFLKDISFLLDKLIPLSRNLGEFDDAMAEELQREIPGFTPIPAYLPGYIRKEGLSLPIHALKCEPRGRKRRHVVITRGVGIFTLSEARAREEIMRVDPALRLPIFVDPMIELSEQRRFLANSGALEFGVESWRRLAESL